MNWLKNSTRGYRLLTLLALLAVTYCTVPNPIDGHSLAERSFQVNPPIGWLLEGRQCYWEQDGVCPSGNVEQALSIYRPDTPFPKGVLLYVHGGSWNGTGAGITGRDLEDQGAHPAPKLAVGSSSDTMADANDPSQQIPAPAGGWIVASMDYTSATPTSGLFPAALHDVKVAMRFVRQRLADPAGLKLVVMGHSAGAHLAALAALSANDENDPIGPASSSRTIPLTSPTFPPGPTGS